MIKAFTCLIFLCVFFFTSSTALAQSNNFVSVVNPIRGSDFWALKDQTPQTAVLGQMDILKKQNIEATWLIRFDALVDSIIVDSLKTTSDEKGLFLEVIPSWTDQAGVKYHTSDSWHAAGSAFLTGYERDEREKLIDTAFEKFKNIYGVYPKSVGAWWVDGYSLNYMQKKYGITAALIVADQYTTDNYQIWGQYFSTPYYPSKNNALHPAQTLENKLPVVVTQWAARDPLNAYGNGVFESTFSVQDNDYLDFHNLDTTYFSKLLDIYVSPSFNKFSNVVIGLENSYSWQRYSKEYENQINTLARMKNSGQISTVTLVEFSSWYKNTFPDLSPQQVIVANDPLGSDKKAVWFMNPYYRAGWFFNQDGSIFRDIHQYIGGDEELCFKQRCENVNFATSATRVLDDVSFGHKWVIDEGKIRDFQVKKENDSIFISYKNEVGNIRQIKFLLRDIGIDDKIFSIDQAILDATRKQSLMHQNMTLKDGALKWSVLSVLQKLSEFLVFLFLVIILPGLVLSNKFFDKNSPLFLKLFISSTVGFVVLTLIYYITSLLKFKQLIFLYILLCLILFFRFKLYNYLSNLPKIKKPFDLVTAVIILVGVIFQVIPTFKSGLNFTYGMGFWGPNTHDGIWHISLINQLIKSIPPENPIYSSVTLKNYHFFYDLLIAATNYLSGLPVIDLVFRFYPIIFSLMSGLGSYYIAIRLFESRVGLVRAKVAAIFSLYLIFFAGSFGWIVEYLRERHIGGESAFWANQAVSLNLNPPFAISLVIMITLFHILLTKPNIKTKTGIITIILVGTLISFKSYTGVLVLGSLSVLALVKILKKKDFSLFWIFTLSFVVSVWLFLSNFEARSTLLVFAPFWLVHSMVDSPDRVGWVRLSLARYASQAQGQWLKFLAAEALSLTIFIFGNLGLRFLSFGILIKIKDIFKEDCTLFIFILTILSTVIPILFIQSGNPWNTIQFFYPVLYISALFSGLVISTLLFKLNKVFVVCFVCIILILAPINSVVTANGYLGKTPHAFVSSKELEALQFLSKQPEGIVLTHPYDKDLKQRLSEPWPLFAYDSTAYVSALSSKNVYLEDEPQNQILLIDYKKRLVASKDFFVSSNVEKKRFLQSNAIKYIYLPKVFNKRIEESSEYIKRIFENDEVIIYQGIK